jgi:hypothetical protein
MGHDVAAAPDELEELEGELDGTIDEDLEDLEDGELDEESLPDGFVVEGETADDADDVAEVDEGATIVELVVVEDPDDFEEDLAPSVTVAEEDDVLARRSGEFICTRCYLVKANSQMVNRSKKICRDCA